MKSWTAWEFPPFVTGGLGMACYGLVKALLKSEVEVLLVLPKELGCSYQEFDERFIVFGAGNWKTVLEKEAREFHTKQKKEAEIYQSRLIRINSRLRPYLSTRESNHFDLKKLSEEAISSVLKEQKRLSKRSFLELSQEDIIRSPNLHKGEKTELYGENLIADVYEYAQIAASIADSLDFDLIHCHDWMTFQAGILAKKVSGKPLLCQVHATEFDRCPEKGNEEVHRLESLGCHEADKVIAVSNFTKKTLVEKYLVPAEKISVVHNGIEVSQKTFEQEEEQKTKERNRRPKVLFLGRVTYQKGPNYFLEAAHKVIKVYPEVEFIIAGSGDMLDYVRARVHELEISDNFRFTGMISTQNVNQVYKEADCFVMSSVSEPFGLTALEAIANQTPVILSRQSGVSEVLRHVLRYDFWDVDKLSSLILSVLTYEPLAEELKTHAEEELRPISWDSSADKVGCLYRELIYRS